MNKQFLTVFLVLLGFSLSAAAATSLHASGIYSCSVQYLEESEQADKMPDYGDPVAFFTIDTTTEDQKGVTLPGNQEAVHCVTFRTVPAQLTCLYSRAQQSIAAASIEVGSAFLSLQVLEAPAVLLSCQQVN